jgi:hypothetical protein
MTNAISHPSGGSVVLRGVDVDLDSDIGNAFTIDCARFVEGINTADQLKAKYRLSDDAWRQLAKNEPLQQAVGRQKERRVRSGEAVREKAQHLFLTAPDVLGGIITSDASPRHKVEAIRELRQCAAVGPETPAAAADRFIIRIDLSADGKREVIEFNKPLEIGSGHDKEDPGRDSESE